MESSFLKEERENIEKVIVEKIESYIYEILEEKKMKLNGIGKIGIAAPRKY